MHAVIIGSGVIGLATAWYLLEDGWEVDILEQTDGKDSCSFGNAGYISPSHFIPLASPGIVAQGLKWMLSASSPFYIRPRASMSLLKWGFAFYRSANHKNVAANAPHLYNILKMSRELMVDLDQQMNHGFSLQEKGCLMLYKHPETGRHEAALAREANSLGMEAQVLSASEVQAMEPDAEVRALGGVYFPSDCHLHPIHMMNTLREQIVKRGGRIHYNHTFEGVVQNSDSCKQVIAGNQVFAADHFILAPGSWLQSLAGKFGISLLLQPGKGYSVTYTQSRAGIKHPAILIDDRVALTPLGNSIRVGGTMELGGINHNINMTRVKPIIKAANAYYPGLSLPEPNISDVWSGLRPCSPDGLPYIGKSPHHENVWIAGGHAMIGISLAAATGKLISQMAAGRATEIPVEAFRINRFS